MDRRFEINTPAVVSEIIDGEAIMIHLPTSAYFSAPDVGGLIWRWMGEGRSRDGMLGLLTAKFAEDPAAIAAALNTFLADLLSNELIREVGVGSGPVLDAAAEAPIDAIAAFSPPVLNVYTDMKDYLLVDPIHDVDDAAGWPTPKRAASKA